MAPTIIGGNRNAAISTTLNFAIPLFGLAGTSVESQRQWPVRFPGYFSNYFIIIDNVATARISTLRKNGSDGLSISPPDGASGQFTNTGGVRYAAADLFDAQNRFTGATGFTINGFGAVYSADVGTVAYHLSTQFNTGATGPGFGTFGGVWFTGADTSGKVPIRAPGVCSNMIASVTTNTDPSAAIVRTRKNSANGAQSVSIPANSTGVFEDTVNSDTLSNGDLFGFQYDAVAVAGVVMILGAVMSHSTPASEIPSSTQTYAFNAAAQFQALLYSASTSTVEATFQSPLGIDGSLSNMRSNVATNSMTGTTTFAVRKNGQTGNQSLTIGAAATGNFEDVTNKDSFFATDLLNYQITGGVSGSIQTGWVFTTMLPAGPFAQYDWNKPFRVKGTLFTPSQPYMVSLLYPPTQLRPAHLSKPYQMAQIPLDPTRGLNLSIFQNPVPFNQYDWNRVLGIAPPPPQSATLNLALNFAFVPFALYDWSRPLQPAPATPLTLPLNLNLFTNPIPFGPYDYSRGPTRVPQAQRDLSQSLNPLMFTNPFPFAQLDWSKPVRIGPVRRDMSLPKNLSLTGGGVVTVQIHQNHFLVTMGMRPL